MATLGRERRWLWLAIVALLLGLVPTAVAGTTAPAPGGAWVAVGSMVSGRKGHTATLLADGTVLVVGGVADGRQTLASAERYDPATGSWRAAASLTTPRYGQTATLLRDGTVLVTGGFNVTISPEGYPDYQFLSSAERYDPRTDVWRPAGAMSAERAGQTATLLRDGTVLVAGCYCLSVDAATAEIYDPAADTWLAPTQMVEWHGNHTATLLADGRVLVAGADGIDGPPLQDAELYDPATASWSRTGDMREGRIGQTATLLPDGTVLVTGGSDTFNYLASAERYDPGDGNLAADRGHARSPRLLRDGGAARRHRAGGGGNRGEQPGLAERYDPASGTWAVAPHMAVDREESAAVALRDGTVLVIGGSDGERTLASAELFDPRLPAPPAPAALPGSWQPTGPLTAKRSDHGHAARRWLGAAGGRDRVRPGGCGALRPRERHLVAGRSAQAGPLRAHRHPAGRRHRPGRRRLWLCGRDRRTLRPGDRCLVVGRPPRTGPRLPHRDAAARRHGPGGGRGRGGPSVGGPSPTSDAERYDPATDTWRAIAPLPIGLSQHTAVLLRDGGVMIVGRQEAAKGTRGDPVTASRPLRPGERHLADRGVPQPVAPLPSGARAARRHGVGGGQPGRGRALRPGARHLACRGPGGDAASPGLHRDALARRDGAGGRCRVARLPDRGRTVRSGDRPLVARRPPDGCPRRPHRHPPRRRHGAGGGRLQLGCGARRGERRALHPARRGGTGLAHAYPSSSPAPTPIPSATPVPTAVPSPIPSAAPLPGMPPTGGGGKAPDSRWRLPLLVLGAAALLVLAGLVSPPRRAARARRVE
ncbi:MAG: kelch repeat-containing protein [Thermomicrobiales bacterium]